MSSSDSFPSTPAPRWSILQESQYNTLISTFDASNEQRRRLWRFPKRTFTLEFSALSQTNRDIVHTFWKKRYGAYDHFYFADPVSRKWVDERVGIGIAGATSEFNMPFTTTLSSGAVTIYRNGVTTDGWHLHSSGMITMDGLSRCSVSLGTAPSAGDVVTCDCSSGKLSIRARFADDGYQEMLLARTRYNVQVKIVEIGPTSTETT